MLEMNVWPCLVGRVVIPQGHRVVVLLGLCGGSVAGGKCAIIFRVFARRSLDEVGRALVVSRGVAVTTVKS